MLTPPPPPPPPPAPPPPPPPLCHPLAVCLQISDEHKAQFKFDQVIVLSPAFLDKVPRAQAAEASAAAALPGSKRPRQEGGDDEEEDAEEEDGMLPPQRKVQYDMQEQYMHFEEELLAARATVNFSFPVTAAAAAAGAGQSTPGASSSSAAATGGSEDALSYSNGVGALRRVLIVPSSHLPRAAAGMDSLLASAQEAAEEEAADLQRLAQEIGQALPASKRARKLVITPLLGGGAAAAKQ